MYLYVCLSISLCVYIYIHIHSTTIIPGHPWDEKGLHSQKGVGLLESVQERRALFVPLVNG